MPGYIYIRIWVLFKSLSVRECKCSSVCFCCTLFVFVFLSFFKDFPSSVSLVSLPLLHFKPAPFISLLSPSATLSLFFLRVFPALFVSLVLFSLVSCFHFFFLAFSHPLPSFFSPPHRSWLIDFIFILLAVVPSFINHQRCLLSSRHWSLYSRSQPISTEHHYLLSLFLFCCLLCLVFCALWVVFFNLAIRCCGVLYI